MRRALLILGAVALAACGGGSSSTGSTASASGAGSYLDGCTPAACGPPMAAPNYLCVDGTLGGPGPCVRSAAGTCGWTYRTCQPVEPCPLDACARSAVPPSQCADGSLAGPLGVCTLLADGACVEVVRRCPAP